MITWNKSEQITLLIFEIAPELIGTSAHVHYISNSLSVLNGASKVAII